MVNWTFIKINWYANVGTKYYTSSNENIWSQICSYEHYDNRTDVFNFLTILKLHNTVWV